MVFEKFLYNRGIITRPLGSQLGEVEPTLQAKGDILYLLTLVSLQSKYPIGGVDISRWQGIMDWGKLESELYFAYIQSSYGAAGIDSAFKINLKEAQKRNMAFGLYHYLKPGNDFRKTANLFYNCWVDSGSQLPPAFDLEQNDGLSVKDLNNWMEKVIKTFNELARAEVLKVCYSSASYINQYVMKTPTYDWLKLMDFWDANWTTASEPLLPLVFSLFAKPKGWEWWQYSSKGDGKKYGASSPNIDLNRSHCTTLAAFNAKYGVNLIARPVVPPPPPPPPPPPVDDTTPLGKMWVHTPNGLLIRSGPGQDFKILESLPYKSIVTPIQVDGDNAWIEIAPGKWVCATLFSGGQHLRFLEKLSPGDLAYIQATDGDPST